MRKSQRLPWTIPVGHSRHRVAFRVFINNDILRVVVDIFDVGDDLLDNLCRALFMEMLMLFVYNKG